MNSPTPFGLDSQLANLKVSWFLVGTRETASSRLQGYAIHEWLRSHGVASEILFSPLAGWASDIPWDSSQVSRLAEVLQKRIAVFQKLAGPRTISLIKRLRSAGVPTVYVDSDYGPQNEVGLHCDAVICPSIALVGFYRALGATKVLLIQDPVEFWVPPSPRRWDGKRTPHLRIGWVGNSNNWGALDGFRTIINEPEFKDYSLITVSDHRHADIRWKLRLFPEILQEFDIGVIPTGEDKRAFMKSANRATLFMAAGVPVIAGRIPAYEGLIEVGVNGFLAQTPEEFRMALRRLRDPEERRRIGLAGYNKAQRGFTIESTGAAWVKVLSELLMRKSPRAGVGRGATHSHRCKTLRSLRAIHLAVSAEEALRRHDFGTAAISAVCAAPLNLCDGASRRLWLTLAQRSFIFAASRVFQKLAITAK